MKDFQVLLCNSSIARIYAVSKQQNEITLEFAEELNHPESSMKNSELITHKQGERHTSAVSQGGFEPSTFPKDVEAEKFSQILAQKIKFEKDNSKYKGVFIFAAPHFLGLLKKNLATVLPNLQNYVLLMENKNYTGETPQKLKQLLSQAIEKFL